MAQEKIVGAAAAKSMLTALKGKIAEAGVMSGYDCKERYVEFQTADCPVRIYGVNVKDGIVRGKTKPGVTSVNISNIGNFPVIDGKFTIELGFGMRFMINGDDSITSLDLSGLDTNRWYSTSEMFGHCTALESIELSALDTSNVTRMDLMFYCCSSLSIDKLDVLDTSNVRTMQAMFMGCSSMSEFNVSYFDTSRVENMSGMFQDCTELYGVDGTMQTTNLENVSSMFAGCSRLRFMVIEGLDLSKVTDMSFMFQRCYNINCIRLLNFGAQKNVDTRYLFNDCSKWGLDEYEYDDVSTMRQSLVDTLLTNSFDRAAAGYPILELVLPDEVFFRLTTSERAAIANKGFTILTQYEGGGKGACV